MKKQSEWKVTNRGRYRYNRGKELRLKGRKNGEWYVAYKWGGEELQFRHYIPETITKVVMRRQTVTMDELPEEVRNEILLWKMQAK